MSETETSRRVFIGGLAVAAAAAGTASAALLKNLAAGDGTTGRVVVDGTTAKAVPAPTVDPMNGWAKAIGEKVYLSSDAGRVAGHISAVVAGTDVGKRPAGLRQQSYTVYLEFAPRVAPAGDRIYDLDRVIDGASKIFVTRGQDVAGVAVLAAVFN